MSEDNKSPFDKIMDLKQEGLTKLKDKLKATDNLQYDNTAKDPLVEERLRNLESATRWASSILDSLDIIQQALIHDLVMVMQENKSSAETLLMTSATLSATINILKSNESVTEDKLKNEIEKMFSEGNPKEL